MNYLAYDLVDDDDVSFRALLLTQDIQSKDYKLANVRMFSRISRKFAIPKDNDLFLFLANTDDISQFEIVKLDENDGTFDVASVFKNHHIESFLLGCDESKKVYELTNRVITYQEGFCIVKQSQNSFVSLYKTSFDYDIYISYYANNVTDVESSSGSVRMKLSDYGLKTMSEQLSTFLENDFEKGCSIVAVFDWCFEQAKHADNYIISISLEPFTIMLSPYKKILLFILENGECLDYELKPQHCDDFKMFYDAVKPHLGKDTLSAQLTKLDFLNG